MRRTWAILATAVLLLGALALPLRAATVDDRYKAILTDVIQVVEALYVKKVDTETLWKGAIQGALKTLNDPHTTYFTTEEYQDFLNSLEGTFTGIGAYIEQVESYIQVISPIKGSPAEKAGLKPGDRILEVNGISLRNVPTETAVKHIRGPEGSWANLKIERNGVKLEIKIQRARIVIPTADTKMLENNIGYLELIQFSSDAPDAFFKGVESLKAQGAKGIILDLRNNGGGYLHASVKIAEAFVPKGKAVLHENLRDGALEITSSTSDKLLDLPFVVLVNEGTASASEILAGAIQDYKAAPVVGVKTYGKGTVQQIMSLQSGGGIKVTIAEYLTANKNKVDGVGLTPDVLVENKPAVKPQFKDLVIEPTRYMALFTVGVDVRDLQQRLNFLGFKTPEDGFFSVHTQNAVVSLQRTYGLPWNDGVVDKATLDELNKWVKIRIQQYKAPEQPADQQLAKALEILKTRLPN